MKKRLKGLLAFWLCMIMLVGGSMTAFAAEYKVDDLNVGAHLTVSDEITGECRLSAKNGEFADQRTVSGALIIGDIIKGAEDGSNLEGTWQVVEKKMRDNEGFFTIVIAPLVSEGAAGTAEVFVPAFTEPACKHNMVYEIMRKPTEYQDGEWAYRCSKCSHVLQTFPICGLFEFYKRVIGEVNAAAPNAAITVTTDRWMSFNKDVYDALAARPDVTLTVNYRYQGEFHSTTIPAGTDMTPYLTEDGYCGFLYLNALFGEKKPSIGLEFEF